MKTPNFKQIFGVLFVVLTLASCSKKEDFPSDDNSQNEEINIGLTFRKASLRNQPIEFKVFNDQGVEIIDNVSIFVDGELLSDNMYQAAEESTHEVYAEYELNGNVITTDTETFNVVIPKQKVVMEDYTGTWCGYCPSVDAAVKEVIAQTPHYTAIAIHNNDDLAIAIEPIIRAEFGVFGFPSGRINRTQVWGSTINFPTDDVLDIAGNVNTTGISIDPQANGNSLTVKVVVASEEALQDKKLVVYLLEDGFVRDQTNYFNEDPSSPYFGLGNPIPDFELDHVLRASLSDPFGDTIPSTSALTDYEATFTYTIGGDMNVDKLSVVAIVVEQDNTAVNSQRAHVNEAVYFE